MNKYLLSLVIMVSTGCNLSHDSNTTDARDQQSSTSGNSKKCSSYSFDECFNEVLLSCTRNSYTKKCVDRGWEELIPEGDCATVNPQFCDKVKVAKEHNGTLVTIGLCRSNKERTLCEAAPVWPKNKEIIEKKCVPTTDLSVLKKASDEICNQYQLHGGTSDKTALALGQSCGSITLPGDALFGSITGLCSDDQNGCKTNQDLKQFQNPVGRFCDGLIKKEIFAKDDFSDFLVHQDYSACESTNLYTLPDAKNKQVQFNGSISGICTLVDAE